MSRPTKFVKGDAFENVGTAVQWVIDGNWVYWRNTPKHPGWMLGLQVRTFNGVLPSLSRALPREVADAG